MKLQQLRFLLAVVENDLNITAAAEALFTSQPGVSKQIRLLEDELDLQIFVRNGKRVVALTDAGRRVVEHASRVLQETERIKSLADELRAEDHGTLALATTQTQARYVLPDVIGEFRQRFPRVDFHVHQGTTEQIARMLDDRQIDFAIVSGSSEPFPDVTMLPIYQWDRVLVVPEDHPLASAPTPPDLETLSRYPLVTYVFSDRPESSLMTAFSTQGLKPRIAFTARDADVIKTYVRSGFGVGILAGLAVEPGTDDDLAVIEIPELFPRLTTWIGYPKDLLLKKYHCEFIRLLAPHLTVNVIEAICSGSDAAPPGGWPAELEIPLRNGGK
ncbi:MAG: LysR family transcriptional regulator [Xanthomonadales bacterium]|nr:LysR family transcriptional regulator [Xanthomonadales bacterium]|tara:strand:- start:144 stop:1133 length:990 start_codon:yes stop_codon:yes gene_type:complete